MHYRECACQSAVCAQPLALQERPLLSIPLTPGRHTLLNPLQRQAYEQSRVKVYLCVLNGRVHAGDDPVAHLRALAARLGLEVRQLVALAGTHPLCGRWWPGTAVPEDAPPRFSNAYFRCARAPAYGTGVSVSAKSQALAKSLALLVSGHRDKTLRHMR